MPMEAPTEIKTKITPVNDKLNFPSMKNLFQLEIRPNAKTMYTTINAYEAPIVGISPVVSLTKLPFKIYN